MSLSRKYQHTPLPPRHFRTVVLESGLSNDSIRLQLQNHDLNQQPCAPYRALSYCWGDSTILHRCECADESTQGILDISSGLWQALKQLRLPNKHLVLWIDQICINQENLAEKSEQVRLMGSIYSMASQVLVWLGEGDSDTPSLFRHLADWWAQLDKAVKEKRSELIDPNDETEGIYYPLQLWEPSAPEWEHFRKLLQLPWFERAWTLQEIVLSNSDRSLIICGPQAMKWQNFHLVCAAINGCDHPGGKLVRERRFGGHLKPVASMGLMQLECNGEGGQRSSPLAEPLFELLNLVKLTGDRKATVPHDKIYSLLGMANDEEDLSLAIDYHLPFGEAYAIATRHFIKQRGDLSALCYASDHPLELLYTVRQGPASLPSWVPDYRHIGHSSNLNRHHNSDVFRRGRAREHNSTGLSRAMLIPDDTNFLLTLKGIEVGRLLQLSDSDGHEWTARRIIGKNVLIGGNWSRLAASYAVDGIYLPTEEPVELAFRRLRIGDYLMTEHSSHARRVATKRTLDQMPEPEKLADLNEKHNALGNQMFAYTLERKLFITNTGYMGIAHQSCMVGDHVYLLMGGDIPFVLRKLDTGRFVLQSEAYVHGIMDGEYLLQNFKRSEQDNEVWLDSLANGLGFEDDLESVTLT